MKTKPNAQEDLPDLTEAVRSLLERHPDVADTAIGIAQWRLPKEGMNPTTREVQGALDELVALSLVLKHEQLDGRITYRINPSKGLRTNHTTEQK